MTRALLQAAAIVTLAVPVGLVGAAVYCMVADLDRPVLFDLAKTSLGFIFGTLATKVWSE